jgi:hypothetical protein
MFHPPIVRMQVAVQFLLHPDSLDSFDELIYLGVTSIS